MPSNQNQWLYIILAFAAGVAVGANWPEIRQKIAPLLNAGNQKFGDLYAYLAQLMSEQKENFASKLPGVLSFAGTLLSRQHLQ